MKAALTYVRSLLSWISETPGDGRYKRDRNDDELSLDEESPALKRIKQVKRTRLSDSIKSKESWGWETSEGENVRYVPIRVERREPATSTPVRGASARRSIPARLVSVEANSEARGPKLAAQSPVRRVYQLVVDDDDDDDEVVLIESKHNSNKATERLSEECIELDDDSENERDTGGTARGAKACKRSGLGPGEGLRGYPSPRTFGKFAAPAGVFKAYKKAPAAVPGWMRAMPASRAAGLPLRTKFAGANGSRGTLAGLFDLDEKKSYRELIRRVTESMPVGRVVRSAEDIAELRTTRRAQKKALQEVELAERELAAEGVAAAADEYGPATVASLGSEAEEGEDGAEVEAAAKGEGRVRPVNSLREALRERPVASAEWLGRVGAKYRRRWQAAEAELRGVRREADLLARHNEEQKLAQLERRMRRELSIAESVVHEPTPEAHFPPLTDEQERAVSAALGPGPPGQVLAEKFNLRITRRDLQTLAGLNWLNDEVINFYMNLLMQRSAERADLPRVYATNTFFWPKLAAGGQAALRRWTRRVDVFAHELLVVPVHLGVHWCMALVDFRRRRVRYLDSMGGENARCGAALLQYLRDEHADKKGAPFDDAGWRADCERDIPQQMNGSDCGVFACTFAEFACRDASFGFSQAHMPFLRRKTAAEILAGRLLL